MRRTFILGDEWLYYKIYCGKRTADMVLVSCIKPLTETLLTNKLIDQWFFIRYTDPNPHLRIRFHCAQVSELGIIIESVNKAVSNYIKNGLVWKVQTDTYNREIERYGEKGIEEAEQLFYLNSNLCVKGLQLIEDDTLLFMFALRSINILLEVFDFSLQNKLIFTNDNVDAFKTEFNSNKSLSKQLNKKYNGLRKGIIEFMEMQSHVEYEPLIDLFNNQRDELEIVKKELQNNINLNDLLSSYIHMTVNRIFRDKQRLHELVCYDSLYRFYNFKLAVNKSYK